MTIIKTTATIKKITSGKGVEIVLSLPASVSLDELSELKQRDEFYIALGVSQMEVRDYLEPRRGLQIVTNSGSVESIKSTDEDGNQLAIDDVRAESIEAAEENTEEEIEIDEESETESEEDSELEETEQEEQDPEDPDKPLTFVDSDLPF
jgi:TATA-binding protein-associated factor Taf7